MSKPSWLCWCCFCCFCYCCISTNPSRKFTALSSYASTSAFRRSMSGSLSTASWGTTGLSLYFGLVICAAGLHYRFQGRITLFSFECLLAIFSARPALSPATAAPLSVCRLNSPDNADPVVSFIQAA